MTQSDYYITGILMLRPTRFWEETQANRETVWGEQVPSRAGTKWLSARGAEGSDKETRKTFSLPFDGARRFGADVIDDAVDAAHLGNQTCGKPPQHVVW